MAFFPFFGGHVNMKGEKSGQIFTLKSPGGGCGTLSLLHFSKKP
jgi:hypothetical protein